MTSNFGAEFPVNRPEGGKTNLVRQEVIMMVRTDFPPEFLDRIDAVILFRHLQKNDTGKVVDIQFARLARMLEE